MTANVLSEIALFTAGAGGLSTNGAGGAGGAVTTLAMTGHTVDGGFSAEAVKGGNGATTAGAGGTVSNVKLTATSVSDTLEILSGDGGTGTSTAAKVARGAASSTRA